MSSGALWNQELRLRQLNASSGVQNFEDVEQRQERSIPARQNFGSRT
jgi:hypothetical protein